MDNILLLLYGFVSTLTRLKIWWIAFLIGCGIFLIVVKPNKSQLPFPPGPKGLPLIGNVFNLPTSNEHLTYARWGKDYGDVVHVSAFGKHIIILNSARAANELLDQRSAIYSDRPYLPMIHDPDLMDTDFALAFKRYSRSWKRHRRVFTQYINPSSVTQLFSAKQISATFQLLNALLNQPTDIKGTLFLLPVRIILGITYGLNVQSLHDPMAILAERAMELGTEGLKPKYAVNTFPAVKYIPAWFPGNQFKSLARETFHIGKRLIQEPFELAMKKINSEKATPSFVQSAMMELTQDDAEQEQEIKEVAASMYGAGVDTMTSGIQFLMLQLILNPQHQRRAQAELDALIGYPDSPGFRFPIFEDSPALPFISALVKETLRWRPPAATGVPHAIMEDDEYRGWRIPKGAIVFANAWGILHDENVYPEPDKFRPERFLVSEEKPVEQEPHAAFGFGRRVCPGRFLAETTLWIQAACILAAFNISPPQGEDGNDIDVRYAEQAIPGFILHPQEYSCIMTPRSERVAAIIRETELNRL